MAGIEGLPSTTFRIAARRADKRFPIPSPEIERILGRRVQDRTGWPVDLSKPAMKIHVEILTDEAFVYVDKEAGHGRLADRHERARACVCSRAASIRRSRRGG